MARKITLTEALSLRKTLDARIKKLIAELAPLTLSTEDNPTPSGHSSLQAFEEVVKSRWKQLGDIIEYRRKVKSAIIKANAASVVKFAHPSSGAEVEMSIAEIIDLKDNLNDFEEGIIRVLSDGLNMASHMLARNEAEVRQTINTVTSTRVSSSANIKLTDDALEGLKASVTKANKLILRDPLGVAELIHQRSDALSNFRAKIDVALSVANATTMIDIDDEPAPKAAQAAPKP